VTPVVPITAAIAAYERPAGLRRCVDAILAGEALPAEIVVVDQSAGDDVERVLADCATGPVPVGYFRQAKLGLSASRNAAVMASRQTVIAFTDDDCVPAAGWLAEVARALKTEPALAAVAGRVLPLGEPRADRFVISPRVGGERVDFRGRVVPWAVGTGGNFTARREWIERIGGFDSRLGAGSPGKAAEDADLIYRLLGAGGAVRYEPDAVVYHERQTAAQRLASRASYGYGIGALCGLHLRRGDAYAARLMVTWLGKQGLALGRAAASRDRFLVRQRLLSLGGGVRGLFYGLWLS
jgi:GT2 family glycosyltransferase